MLKTASRCVLALSLPATCLKPHASGAQSLGPYRKAVLNLPNFKSVSLERREP